MGFENAIEPRFNFGNDYDLCAPIFGDLGEVPPDVLEVLEGRGIPHEDWAAMMVKRFGDEVVELWVSKYNRKPNPGGFVRVL